MNSRINFNGASIRQYSTTFLLLGSMSSYVYARPLQETYAVHSFDQALQQSMVAEFALAYDDIPRHCIITPYLQLEATQQPLNSVP